MPRRHPLGTPGPRPEVGAREIKKRIKKLREIKFAYMKLHGLSWGECILPLSELDKMGPVTGGRLTEKQVLVLGAAEEAQDPFGNVTVRGVMAAMGLDPFNHAARSIIQSRIQTMCRYGFFPFKIVPYRAGGRT